MGYHVIHLQSGLKKAQTLPPLQDTLVKPEDPQDVELELDEKFVSRLRRQWSFVRSKANKRWVWLAFCKGTSQVVASVIGGRGIKTCTLLWQTIPSNYKQGLFFTDFWEAYKAVLPDEQHQPVSKQSGLTNHVERFNNTIRQRLARFVRKSLSFSKSDQMHLICLHLALARSFPTL